MLEQAGLRRHREQHADQIDDVLVGEELMQFAVVHFVHVQVQVEIGLFQRHVAWRVSPRRPIGCSISSTS